MTPDQKHLMTACKNEWTIPGEGEAEPTTVKCKALARITSQQTSEDGTTYQAKCRACGGQFTFTKPAKKTAKK